MGGWIGLSCQVVVDCGYAYAGVAILAWASGISIGIAMVGVSIV